MDNERKGSPSIAWCSGIVVLLALYVGAYAAMVRPRRFVIGHMNGMLDTVVAFYSWHPRSTDVFYEMLTSPAREPMEKFFAPANTIDQMLRPSVWNPPP